MTMGSAAMPLGGAGTEAPPPCLVTAANHPGPAQSLRILLVSWFFPPTNTIGAVRLGTVARYLLDRGHDVRVLTCNDLRFPQTLEIPLPGDRIHYSDWADVNALPKAVERALYPRRDSTTAPAAQPGGAEASREPRRRSLGKAAIGALHDLYVHLTNCPDSRAGWYPYAVRFGEKLLRNWRPDLVFGSGPPFTALLVAHRLSKRHGLPLVVEFRDRWSDDPYYPPPRWRHRLDRFMERRVIAGASAITTVSAPWADTYRRNTGKPVAVVFNGYDAELCAATPSQGSTDADAVRIVYTGRIYPGRRDPTPLFRAIGRLGSESRLVRVEFYGTDPGQVLPLAEREGIAGQVIVHGAVTHAAAVERQRRADVLLLMQWNDPREQGNVPGKFFEYLGALRPMLVLGLADGVPATLLRERNAGFFANDPDEIAAQLRDWIATKRARGHIPALPEDARRGFAREEQYRELEAFLRQIAANASAANASAGASRSFG